MRKVSDTCRTQNTPFMRGVGTSYQYEQPQDTKVKEKL